MLGQHYDKKRIITSAAGAQDLAVSEGLHSFLVPRATRFLATLKLGDG